MHIFSRNRNKARALRPLLLACVLGSSAIAAVAAGAQAATPSTPAKPAARAPAGALPAWLAEPKVLPQGRRGKNNCTFAFGQVVPQWNFHADAGCWEHAGPDGWVRQQQYRIHVPHFAACGGGAADVSPIRVCRVGGSATSPCGPTGPKGCAVCVPARTCH